MNVLVLAEQHKGKCKKNALELLSYARGAANLTGGKCIAICLGHADNFAELAKYGADKVIKVTNSSLDNLETALYSQAIAEISAQEGCELVILSHSSIGKAISGRLSIRKNTACISGVNSVLQKDENGYYVIKSVFSGKANAKYRISGNGAVISVLQNTIPPQIVEGSSPIEETELALPERKTRVLAVETVEGIVPLPEADLVVSAGRGMKEAANWGIIESLAAELGATTACSRPVADSGWRPHHEHVGQTGLAIRPSLYIAIGISGAIQHLAGVNNSRVIVVINKDIEAPFFKAADYGVCADLFDVVPNLIESIKKYKHSN